MKFQPGQIFRNTQRHVDVDRFSTDRPVFQYVREETPIVEEILPEEEIIEPEKVEENELKSSLEDKLKTILLNFNDLLKTATCQ